MLQQYNTYVIGTLNHDTLDATKGPDLKRQNTYTRRCSCWNVGLCGIQGQEPQLATEFLDVEVALLPLQQGGPTSEMSEDHCRSLGLWACMTKKFDECGLYFGSYARATRGGWTRERQSMKC